MTVARLLVIQNAASDPVGRLGDWLTAAGLELDVRNAEAGATVPDHLANFDGLLVLGGGMGATEDNSAPWLPAVRALLREAITEEKPTLGVCLGAQLLAVANGGTVAPNPGGPEFGAHLIAKRAAASTDPLFGPLPITPDVIQWHFDAITALPPGAVTVASSPGCDVQAFRLGRLAWGIQFHIETTPAIVRSWAATDADALDGYDVDRILGRSDAVHDDLVEVWQPFAIAFAGIVRHPDAVAPARGIPTSTAEPITDPAAIRAALAAEAHGSRSSGVLPMPGVRPNEQ
ncbi:MAG: synthase-like glutamine amidotransferase [Pseudonocardiales bacterium]|nr:synthase-like glutamine amidotransferase [Pseudonocardiales bacterium]